MSNTSELNTFRRSWAEELAETARLVEARFTTASSSASPRASSRNRVGEHRGDFSQHTSRNPINPTTSANLVQGTNVATSMAPPALLSNPISRDHLLPGDSRQQPTRPSRALRHDEGSIRQTPRLFDLGIDYGETRTSVSYLVHSIDAMEEGTLNSTAWDILSVNGWPGVHHLLNQVPSESWYSATPMTRNPLERDALQRSEIEQGHRRERNLYNAEDDDDDDATVQAEDFESFQRDTTGSSNPGDYLWGYTVSQEQYGGNTTRSSSTLVRYVKSGLLNSAYDQGARAPVRRVVAHLLEKGLIQSGDPKRRNKIGRKRAHQEPEENLYSEQDLDPRDAHDILTDFLTRVFQHTSEHLAKFHGFSPLCKLRLVITVPVTKSWSQKSSRILQESVEEALLATKMAGVKNQNLLNVFIIHEPEAAANYIMAATNCALAAGDTIMVADAGGGSFDVTTYSLMDHYPLRLKQEVVIPAGDNCGAANWNESFITHIKTRLENEFYLFQNGETCESIVNRHVEAFETKWKRIVDLNRRNYSHSIEVPYLRADSAKRFRNGKMDMDLENDYIPMIGPWINRCMNVVEDQFKRVETLENPVQVQKVFLVGGAGESPALRSSLRRYLNERSEQLSYEIELVTDELKNSGVANSHGAVLRLQNMGHGPARIALSSFGFLRTEEYSPLQFNPGKGKMEGFAGHSAASPKLDRVDGKKIVRTIDYFLTKGSMTDSRMVFGPIPTYHTIDATWDVLICREEIYVSDTGTESHYTRAHKNNRDAYVAGSIEVDMTFLKSKKKIRPIWPEPGHEGIKHYRVEYDLFAIVEGLTLSYEARWPPGKKGRKLKSGQINIAAAFSPGTK